MKTLSVDNPWLVVDLSETLSVSTVVFTALTGNGGRQFVYVLLGVDKDVKP